MTAGLRPVGAVLDAGAGVGRFTVPLAGRLAAEKARVVATDLFPGMLATIAAAAAGRGLAVEVLVADIQARACCGGTTTTSGCTRSATSRSSRTARRLPAGDRPA
jgi:2-polyprenyl-3-methyl-5-hydroxy-6-metoxy-1,4-benzoquinol methylase